MNFELKTQDLDQSAASAVDALVVLWKQAVPGQPETVSGPMADWIRQAIAQKDLEAGPGKCLLAYRIEVARARRVVVAQVGDGSAAQVRKAVASAMGLLKITPCKTLCIHVGDIGSEALGGVLQSVSDASYVFTTTKPTATPRALQKVTLAVSHGAAVRPAFELARATVAGMEFAREWANRPANHATPTHLATAARQLGKKPTISTEVLGPKEVEKLGMGAFMAVAQGSEQPLRFIVMKYQGGEKSAAPVVLVGKGITFDTGGISLKPAAEMDEMKFDMSGAASVLGVFAALAELQPAINVVGLIPTCENMPGGRSIKPGDVITSMSGQTIEVLNTDAEGRLILCDALTYSQRFKPRAVIDVATLTGACVIALGGVRAGLFSGSDDLARQLHEAGDAALDPCWRMPLDDDYAEGLKSNFADMGNVAGRQAGAVTAAKFLQKFVNDMPWAHLDIAGVAWKSGAAKGATGRPVPLLLQYLVDEAERARHARPASSKSTTVRRTTKGGRRS